MPLKALKILNPRYFLHLNNPNRLGIYFLLSVLYNLLLNFLDEMEEEEEDFNQNLEKSRDVNYRRIRRESGEKFDPKLKKIHQRRPKFRQSKFSGSRKFVPRKNYRYVRYGRGPPYDYQRYAVQDRLVNARTSAVRNVLYWLKDILSLLPANKK